MQGYSKQAIDRCNRRLMPVIKLIKALLLGVNLLIIMALSVSAHAQGSRLYQLDLPEQSCAESLIRLSEIADVMVLFPTKIAKDIKANPVKGTYTLQEALDIMLEGTGFTGSFSEKSVLMISIEKSENNNQEKAMNTNKSILAGLVALLSSTSAIQNTVADVMPTRELEEIIVTSQRRSESLQHVPITVSTFSGEELSQMGVTGVQALQSVTPGLVISNSGAFAQPYLRGVGTRFPFGGLEPSIATYIDGRYVSRPAAGMFDLSDIERVEVLKGPQGTLFGRNATGGAIRVVTKEVADEFEGQLTASGGNYNYWGLSGTVNAPINEDMGIRLTAITKQRDGTTDNLFPAGKNDDKDKDFTALRGKLRWDMTDRIAAGLTLAYWERKSTLGLGNVIFSPLGLHVGEQSGGIVSRKRGHFSSAIDGKDDIKEVSAELNFQVAFDDFDLVSITTFSDYEGNLFFDSDGTGARLFDTNGLEDEEAYSQEIQLASNNNSNWDWLAGTYVYFSKPNYEPTFDAGAPSQLSLGFQAGETKAWSIFGQATWHITERWSLTLGGRWSEEEKKVNLVPSKVNALTVTQVNYREIKDWEDFSPKVTLKYNLDDYLDNAMVWVTYSSGFKSGGFNTPASTNPALDPEYLDMYEVGFKGDLFENRLRLNASAFYYDYTDLQLVRAVSSGGTTFIPITDNTGKSKVLGMDIDVTWLMTDRLLAKVGLNVLDSEYQDYVTVAKVHNSVVTGNPTAPGMSDVIFDADGRSLLRSSDWSAFISLEYAFQLGEAEFPAVLTYSYKDDYDFDFIADPLSQPLRQDGYGVLNARVSYIPPTGNWQLALWTNNLTDEAYLEDVAANPWGIKGVYAEPRTYGIDVRFDF